MRKAVDMAATGPSAAAAPSFGDLAEAYEASAAVGKAARKAAEAAEQLSKLGEACEEAEAELAKMTPGTASYANKAAAVEALLRKVEQAEQGHLDAVTRLREAYGREEAKAARQADREAKDEAKKDRVERLERDERREAVVSAPAQAVQAAKQAGGGAIDTAVSLAGGGAAGALAEFAGKMSGFVEALNPSAVLVFDQAMRDLSAVVGTALMPVFNVLTGAVRQASSLLLPVAQELAPVFGQIAGTVMSLMQPAFQTVTGLIRLAIPPLQLFADLMSALMPLLVSYQTIQAAVVATLADFMKGLLGDDYKSAMGSFKSAMQQLAGAAILAVGALAKLSQQFFGFGGGFLDSLIQATKGGRKEDATGLGAATQGSVTSFQQFEQQELARAFVASGAGGEDTKTDNQWLQDVSKQLEQFRDQNGAVNDWFKANFGEAIELLRAIRDFLRNPTLETLTPAAEAAQRSGLPVGAGNVAILDFLRRGFGRNF